MLPLHQLWPSSMAKNASPPWISVIGCGIGHDGQILRLWRYGPSCRAASESKDRQKRFSAPLAWGKITSMVMTLSSWTDFATDQAGPRKSPIDMALKKSRRAVLLGVC